MSDEATFTTEEAPGRSHRKRPWPVYVLGLLLLLVAFGVALVLGRRRASRESAERETRKDALSHGPRVQVTTVGRSPGQRTITLPGDVRAYEEAILYAKVSGYLKSIRVDKGDRVKKDQILGILESPETDQQVLSAQSDLAIRRTTVDRFKPLAALGVVSKQDYDTAVANLGVAEAALARALALREYETIRAPFDGIVTARYADPGALLPAATGSTNAAQGLVQVAHVDRVRIFVYPGQGDAPFVHEGDAAEVWTDAHPAERRKSTVARTSGALDARTRTMLVEIQLPNRDRVFLPGTYAHVEIAAPRPSLPTVPRDALIFRGGKTFVGVVNDDRLRLAPVTLGAEGAKTVEVVDGLQGGEDVALDVGRDIEDGARVQAVRREGNDKKTGARD